MASGHQRNHVRAEKNRASNDARRVRRRRRTLNNPASARITAPDPASPPVAQLQPLTLPTLSAGYAPPVPTGPLTPPLPAGGLAVPPMPPDPDPAPPAPPDP